MFSPDGRWIAYQSNESGASEVYVVKFPERSGKWRVSPRGGSNPRWRRDGKEIFYLGPDYALMAAKVNGEKNGFEVGSVERLFQARPQLAYRSPFDVSADGQRLLINTLPPDKTPPLYCRIELDGGD